MKVLDERRTNKTFLHTVGMYDVRGDQDEDRELKNGASAFPPNGALSLSAPPIPPPVRGAMRAGGRGGGAQLLRTCGPWKGISTNSGRTTPELETT